MKPFTLTLLQESLLEVTYYCPPLRSSHTIRRPLFDFRGIFQAPKVHVIVNEWNISVEINGSKDIVYHCEEEIEQAKLLSLQELGVLDTIGQSGIKKEEKAKIIWEAREYFKLKVRLILACEEENFR